MIVIGVSNRKIRTQKRGKPVNKGGKRAKRYNFLYYYDENSGKFNARRINKIQGIWYKLHKKKTCRYVCPTCGRSFKGINQKKKDIRCPYCD